MKTRKLSEALYIESEKLSMSLVKYSKNIVASVPFAEMLAFPMNKTFLIGDKAKITRRPSLAGTLEIDLQLKKGAKIGWHYHDDCDEYITVISGRLVDINTELVYERGDTVLYKAMQEHIPIALEKTTLRIFIKQKKWSI